jgi:hypothetical protein
MHELFGYNGNTVVRSVNHGATWTPVVTMPATIWDLAYDWKNSRLYISAGTEGQIVHLYQAQGSTLTDITSRLPADFITGRSAFTVATDPVDPTIVYGGLHVFWSPSHQNTYQSNAAIFRSVDGGNTWTNLTLQPGQTGTDGGGRSAWTVRVNPATRDLWVTTGNRGIWRWLAGE